MWNSVVLPAVVSEKCWQHRNLIMGWWDGGTRARGAAVKRCRSTNSQLPTVLKATTAEFLKSSVNIKVSAANHKDPTGCRVENLDSLK